MPIPRAGVVNIRASPLCFTLFASLPVLVGSGQRPRLSWPTDPVLDQVPPGTCNVCTCGWPSPEAPDTEATGTKVGLPSRPISFPLLCPFCLFLLCSPTLINRPHRGEKEWKLSRRPVCLGLPWDPGLYCPGCGGLDPT